MLPMVRFSEKVVVKPPSARRATDRSDSLKLGTCRTFAVGPRRLTVPASVISTRVPLSKDTVTVAGFTFVMCDWLLYGVVSP